MINYDNFKKLDLGAMKILSAERIEAKKAELLKKEGAMV